MLFRELDWITSVTCDWVNPVMLENKVSCPSGKQTKYMVSPGKGKQSRTAAAEQMHGKYAYFMSCESESVCAFVGQLGGGGGGGRRERGRERERLTDGEREREREREERLTDRWRERERERDRDRDRDRDRHTETGTQKQRDREREAERETETDIQTDCYYCIVSLTFWVQVQISFSADWGPPGVLPKQWDRQWQNQTGT